MSMIRQITKTAEINPNFSGNFMSLLYHCIRNTESPPDPGNLYQIFRGNDQFYKTLALSTKGVKSYFYILAGLASNRKKADRITHILQKNKVLPHFPYSSYLLQFSKLVLHLHKRGADRNSIRDLLSMLKIEIIKDRRSKKISFTDCLLKHHRIHYGQVIFMLADHGLFHPEEYRPEMAEPVFNYIKSLKETERASTLHAILIPSGQTQLHLIFWKMKRKPQFFKGYEAVLPKEWSAKITHELALIEAVNKTTNILFAKHDHHVEPLDESQESHNIALFSY